MLSRREMGALCASLLFCLLLSLGAGWAQSQLTTANQLAADTLRLHIRADTDSVRDQSAKLAVRDAVLVLTDEACPADSRADARAWAAENLVRFELTARQTLAALGIRAPVKACLVNMYFPTRRYDGGALPAGRYDAVRLDIGTRRAGRNWWCVLYPGLCRTACGGYAVSYSEPYTPPGLCRSACGGYDTPAENDLVCGEYIVRFRFVEWWGGLTAPREDVVLAG